MNQHPFYGYPEGFRLRVLLFAKIHGPCLAAKTFNISQKSIFRWRKRASEVSSHQRSQSE